MTRSRKPRRRPSAKSNSRDSIPSYDLTPEKVPVEGRIPTMAGHSYRVRTRPAMQLGEIDLTTQSLHGLDEGRPLAAAAGARGFVGVGGEGLLDAGVGHLIGVWNAGGFGS